jgi:hypothetical protein
MSTTVKTPPTKEAFLLASVLLTQLVELINAKT